MSIFNKYPAIFSILMTLAGAYVLFLSGENFVDIATQITDENVYENVENQLYIEDPLPVKKYEKNEDPLSAEYDTLETGDLLLEIEGRKICCQYQLDSILKSSPNKEAFRITGLDHINFNKDEYFATRRGLQNTGFRNIKTAAIIRYVFKGGASDRAGLHVGDYIIKVNGKSFKNAYEATQLMQNYESGSIITYKILRNNRTFEVDIELAKYGVQFLVLIHFITGIITVFLGLYIALKRPWMFEARLTGVSLVILGSIFCMSLRGVAAEGNIFDLMRGFISMIITYVGISVILHSLIYFPKANNELQKRKWVLWSLYIAGGVFTIAMLTNTLFFNKILILQILQGAPYLLVAFFVTISFIYKKYKTKEYKRISRPVVYSLFINAVLILLINIIRNFNVSIEVFKIAQYSTVISLFIPLSYYYVIARYRLLDIDLRIKKNIQYVIVSGLWRAVLAASLIAFIWGLSQVNFTVPNVNLTGLTIEVLENPLPDATQNVYEKIIIVFLALIFALILRRFDRNIQKFLNIKFYRVEFDYRLASNELSEIMEKTVNPEDLAGSMVEKLGTLVKLKRAGVIFFSEEEVALQKYFGFNDSSLREYCSAAGRKLYKAIDEFDSPVPVDYLDDPIKDILKECKFSYLVPIRSRGKLIGAIYIGEKLSEAAFHAEDLDFLVSIAGQASVSIENAFLYEDLAKRERMKHELDLARRIQLASLPTEVPEVKGMDISGLSIPALEVGGDFYDYLNTSNDDFTIIVGDVSGKGTSAALYMSKAQGIMRTLYEFKLTPKELFVRSNQLMYKYLEKGSFITAIAGKFELNNNKLTFTRAGHMPLLYYNSGTGKVERLVPKGVVLGMTREDIFERNLEELTIEYKPGDIFLFVTDGVTEARNFEKSEFGEDRLIEIFSESINGGANSIRDKVLESVRNFSKNTEQFDDMTLVVARVV